MNRKALLIAGVSAALGLALLLMYQERFRRQAAGGRPVRVVFAIADIPLGEPLTAARVAAREVPEAYIEDRHIRWSDLRRVIGVRVSTGVRANQAVLWTDLATSSDARRDLSSLVRNGMRAVTIRADATSTFGGLIRPGDRVDVLATMPRTGDGERDRVTLSLLQNKLVLAAGRDTGGEAAAARVGAAAPGAGAGGEVANQITLLATVQEAALLVFAQDRGRLSLVLRNPDDIAIEANLPETSLHDILPSRERPRPSSAAAPPRESPHAIEAIRGSGSGGI